MSDTATRLSVSAPAPGISVIEIAGEVTRESDNALREAYEQAADGARSIILGFASLEYMNSSGIGLLVTLLVARSATSSRSWPTGSATTIARSSS